jgi:hypothetical protein
MFDITAPKVLSPALLFAVLSPGLILSLPPDSSLLVQVCMHAILLCIFNFLIIKYGFKLNVTTSDIIVPGLLFIAMTPQVLFSIPSLSLPTSVGVHTLVFALVYAAIRGQFPEYY